MRSPFCRVRSLPARVVSLPARSSPSFTNEGQWAVGVVDDTWAMTRHVDRVLGDVERQGAQALGPGQSTIAGRARSLCLAARAGRVGRGGLRTRMGVVASPVCSFNDPLLGPGALTR